MVQLCTYDKKSYFWHMCNVIANNSKIKNFVLKGNAGDECALEMLLGYAGSGCNGPQARLL